MDTLLNNNLGLKEITAIVFRAQHKPPFFDTLRAIALNAGIALVEITEDTSIPVNALIEGNKELSKLLKSQNDKIVWLGLDYSDLAVVGFEHVILVYSQGVHPSVIGLGHDVSSSDTIHILRDMLEAIAQAKHKSITCYHDYQLAYSKIR